MNTTSAFIALVGRPNVGKSSLLNALVGKKVAIVSDKPQTTRNRIMGVLTRDTLQLVFVDTPGHHRPRTRLGDFMVKTIGEAVSGVDVGVLVVEPKPAIHESERELLQRFAAEKLPVVLAINKIDTVENKEDLLACMALWQQEFEFAAVLPLSALTGDGTDEMLDELSNYAFESPHFFPEDAVSDQPEKVLAAELLREQMLLHLREEIPHGIAVVIEELSERETPKGSILDIDAQIFCERDTHKGMIIGKRGAMLKQISAAARLEMEKAFGTHVNLQCWIKVKEDWRNRQGLLNGFGYRL